MAAAFLWLLSTPRSSAQINQSLGTLLPGESVAIQYDVTITNQIPAGVTALTNQGTLSGSNFASVVTDDPSTAATNDATLTALDVPPALITQPASTIAASNAVLNATVIPAASDASVWFEYGTTTNYGSATAITNLLASPLPAPASGTATELLPGTQYHFRAVGTNAAGSSTGPDLVFTTQPIPPTVITLPATNLSSSSASLNATVNPGGGLTMYYFQYGATTNYGAFSATNSLTAGLADVTTNTSIAGLTPGAQYHFRVIASNSAGTNTGNDQAFTAAPVAPVAHAQPATGIGASNATLNATINPGGGATTYYFVYSLQGSLNPGAASFTQTNSIAAGVNSIVSVSNAITGLLPGTTYYFAPVANNSAGSSLSFAPGSFNTLQILPTIITAAADNLTPTNVTLKALVNPGGGSAGFYFQYGLTTNLGSFSSTNTAGGLSDQFVGTAISGLTPNVPIYYCAVVTNSAGSSTGAVLVVRPINPTVIGIPVAITGFNVDAVLEPGGISLSVNGTLNSWFAAGMGGHPDGLPMGSTFASSATNAGANTFFQMGDGAATNALKLGNGFPTSATLTLVTPTAFRSVSLIGASANGGGMANVTLKFADGTNYTATWNAQDWCVDCGIMRESGLVALDNLGRNVGLNSAVGGTNYGSGFTYQGTSAYGLFETKIDLEAVGHKDRLLSAITVQRAGGAGSSMLFAISGAPKSVFVVGNTNDSGLGSLRQALTEANAFGAPALVLATNVTGTIPLQQPLPIITNSITLLGSGATNLTVSGNSANRILFVDAISSSVNISGLTLANGRAKGGNGGNAAYGGGGGLGAGGAIFVNAGSVTISSVNFSNNIAVGGDGGSGYSYDFGGGGGGFGGNGGGPGNLGGSGGGGGFAGDGGKGANSGSGNSGGGGGGGLYGRGGNSSDAVGGGGGAIGDGQSAGVVTFVYGGAGGYGGGGNGGSYYQYGDFNGQDGQLNGGGGGAGYSPGGGGGGNGGKFGGGGGGMLSGNAGDGGEFGGGGGGGSHVGSLPVAGNGGFGAGGGGGYFSGAGGFGGGAGGAVFSTNLAAPGAFGGPGGAVVNDFYGGAGGGGAALGANIFARGDNGAALTLIDAMPDIGQLFPGTGGQDRRGNPLGGSGSLAGSALFLSGGSNFITLNGISKTVRGTISGWSPVVLNLAGSGTLFLSSSNDCPGLMLVTGASLKLNGGLGFSNTIVNAGGTLQGSGTLRALTINNSTISPGTGTGKLTAGNAEWKGAVNYNWPVYDAAGSPGIGYGSVHIDGTLNLSNAVSLQGNLWSLSAPDVPGLALNFNNPELPHSWVLVHTTGGVFGWGNVSLNISTPANNGTTGFANPYKGSFSLSLEGNDILLNYQPAPATTLPATVLSGAATLNGLIYPAAIDHGWWFEYGLTTNYGSITPSMVAHPNSGVVLNGTNQFGVSAASVNLSNRSFSVEMWLRRDGSNRFDLALTQGTNTPDHGLHIGFRDNNAFTFAFWGDDLNAPTNYSDNDWHHWACTYNVTNHGRLIYRDGVVVASNTANAYLENSPLILGRLGPIDAYFGGALDEIRVWDGVRTSAQINDPRFVAPPANDPALLAFWRLNEGSGNVGFDSSSFSNTVTQNLAGGAPVWTWIEGIDQAQSVSSDISGLVAGQLYHYRLAASNSFDVSFGEDMSFTFVNPPWLGGLSADSSFTNATLNGTINPGADATTYYFQYGVSTNYGSFTATNSLPASTNTSPVNANITGLLPGQICFYRLFAMNSAGATFSTNASFSTLGVAQTVLGAINMLPDRTAQFGFTNVPGAPFTVFATTNISAPGTNWIPIGAPIEGPPGQYQFIDSTATNYPQRFYQLRSP